MNKSFNKICFVVMLSVSLLNTIAVKISIDLILNYYHSNSERYQDYLIDKGNYSWFELIPSEIRTAFRYFQICLFIIIAVSLVTGIITFYFNKKSGLYKKTVIIVSSSFPIMFSVIYPLTAGVI